MEFSELVKIRQSDRKYLDQPVEREKLEQIIDTARLAPSANNAQPWKFVVVDDPGLKEQVAECASVMGLNKFVHQAGAIIVLVMEKPNLMSRVGSALQGKTYPLIDVGIVANQICLQAADLGLGSCMVGWFREDKLQKLLGIDRKRTIPLIITLGYPESDTRPKKRKPLDEVSRWNEY